MSNPNGQRPGKGPDPANPFGVTPLARAAPAPERRTTGAWATIALGALVVLGSSGYATMSFLSPVDVAPRATRSLPPETVAAFPQAPMPTEPATPATAAPSGQAGANGGEIPSVPAVALDAPADIPLSGPPDTVAALLADPSESLQAMVAPTLSAILPPQASAHALTPETAVTATEPAAPPVAVAQVPPTAPDGASAFLMRRAESLLASGDVAAARMLVERVAASGDAKALFALAETYDPVRLSDWHVRGVRADVAKARALYQQALDHGDARAADRLARLR